MCVIHFDDAFGTQFNFCFKKKTDGNPLQLVKGKTIVRFSIKSKANIPRRLNGLTRTATLTLELMAVWSPYFKSKRRLYKKICQCFDPISQSLFQRMAIIRILMENSSFVDCFPLRIRYTRRHILSLLIHRASGNSRDKAIGFPHSLYGSLPIRENGAKIWDVIMKETRQQRQARQNITTKTNITFNNIGVYLRNCVCVVHDQLSILPFYKLQIS